VLADLLREWDRLGTVKVTDNSKLNIAGFDPLWLCHIVTRDLVVGGCLGPWWIRGYGDISIGRCGRWLAGDPSQQEQGQVGNPADGTTSTWRGGADQGLLYNFHKLVKGYRYEVHKAYLAYIFQTTNSKSVFNNAQILIQLCECINSTFHGGQKN
jgi:hypothetical protein